MCSHRITIQFEDKKPIEDIQYLTNYFTTLYVEDMLKKSMLPKNEQIVVLSEILQNFKADY